MLASLAAMAVAPSGAWARPRSTRRYLYVATPGVRNYLEFGGHGLLVFDMDDAFRFVKRIPTRGLMPSGAPDNVKGVCASARTGRLYISTRAALQCLDLTNEQVLWERRYEGGCDRMAITPDGKVIYLPSFEKAHWHVIDAATGEILTRITPNSGAHNTIVGLDGSRSYLAGLWSPLLRVVDTRTNQVIRTVGPFSAPIRPFTINGAQSRAYVNVNDRLGFEIGDIGTGAVLAQVTVEGYQKGPVKRHGCPSHGIGLTPDEAEIWICDAANRSLHVFDNRTMPPRQVMSIAVRDEPGWVTFSLDGRFAFPSTGEIIDVKSKKIVHALTDEQGQAVMSEKMVEVHFRKGAPIRTGDQFGVGRVT
jgi:DNA-binding beta-propeller fold protein YncE